MPDSSSDEVNSQITEADARTNMMNLGQAPAMALGSLYQTIGNSLAMAAANAVYSQQQANIANQAATTKGVALLLSLGKPSGSTDG
jgi:hypothetical protein